MQTILTPKEMSENSIIHAARLRIFAEQFSAADRGMRARCQSLVEAEAYAILEVFAPRPRSILRYIRRVFNHWRLSMWVRIKIETLIWYHRRVKGLDLDKAIDLACAMQKGANDGRRN